MTGWLLAGAGIGAGLLALLRGLFPPRPPLAALLAHPSARNRLLPGPQAPATTAGTLLGRPLATLAAAFDLPLRATRRDLAVTGKPLEQHLAEKALLGMLGMLLGPATLAGLALIGYQIPLAVPAWAAVLLGAGGFVVPDLGLRAEAGARRRQARHALGAFLDLTVVSLAGGAGVEEALDHAATIGHGWATSQLRRALDTARLRREPPWVALAQLGGELGVEELGELAASLRLAGAEGAKVRASLAAKAASLRAHRLADAEAQAQSATEQMSLPVVLLFAAFLLFIGFPAVMRIVTGL